jgi:tRNA(fMet)-specific endonuclease VapC
MGVLIDASVLLEAARGRLDLEKRLAGREEEPFHLAAVTAADLLFVAHRADRPDVRARRAAFVSAVLERIPVLDLDLATARAHAELRALLQAEGVRIGPHDLWLAAACVAHGLALATTSTRELARVPGLTVENWSRG